MQNSIRRNLRAGDCKGDCLLSKQPVKPSTHCWSTLDRFWLLLYSVGTFKSKRNLGDKKLDQLCNIITLYISGPSWATLAWINRNLATVGTINKEETWQLYNFMLGISRNQCVVEVSVGTECNCPWGIICIIIQKSPFLRRRESATL